MLLQIQQTQAPVRESVNLARSFLPAIIERLIFFAVFKRIEAIIQQNRSRLLALSLMFCFFSSRYSDDAVLPAF